MIGSTESKGEQVRDLTLTHALPEQVDAPKLLGAWKQLFLRAPWDPTHQVVWSINHSGAQDFVSDIFGPIGSVLTGKHKGS